MVEIFMRSFQRGSPMEKLAELVLVERRPVKGGQKREMWKETLDQRRFETRKEWERNRGTSGGD